MSYLYNYFYNNYFLKHVRKDLLNFSFTQKYILFNMKRWPVFYVCLAMGIPFIS